MAKGVKAGEAFVELGVRSQIDKGLKAASSKLKKFGGGLAKVGALVTGAAIAAGAKPLMLASEMEETMGKFNVVFGENARVMEAWANTNARVLGTTRQEMAAMTSGMQDLLVPMGLSPEAATKFSKGLSTLAVDLASFNNKATPQVMEDLMSAMTGSGEVMKKYGVILNVANMENFAYANGIAEMGAKLSDVQKAQAAYGIILAGTTAAQGDAVRTSASFANQSKRLFSGLSDLGVMIGNVLLPPLTKVLSVIGKLVQGVIEWGRNNQFAMDILGKGILIIGGAGAVLTTLGGILIAAGAAFSAVAGAISAVGTGFALVFTPMGAAVLVITGVIVALGAAVFAVAKETGVLGEAIDLLKDLFGDVGRLGKMAFGGIVDAFKAGDMKLAMAIAMEAVKAILFRGLQAMAEAFERFGPRMAAGLLKLAKKILPMAAKIAQAMIQPWRLPGAIRDLTGGSFKLDLGSGSFSERAQQSEARLGELSERAAKLREQKETAAAMKLEKEEFDQKVSEDLLKQIATNTKTPMAQFG